jgi:prevent-host-death family protein
MSPGFRASRRAAGTMHTFSIRELRDKSGELSREAEDGNVSLITKHGQPLMVSVPFDRTLVESGVNVALAVNLFKSAQLSIGMAARVARMPKTDFIELVSDLGIPVVNYDTSELEDELRQF